MVVPDRLGHPHGSGTYKAFCRLNEHRAVTRAGPALLTYTVIRSNVASGI